MTSNAMDRLSRLFTVFLVEAAVCQVRKFLQFSWRTRDISFSYRLDSPSDSYSIFSPSGDLPWTPCKSSRDWLAIGSTENMPEIVGRGRSRRFAGRRSKFLSSESAKLWPPRLPKRI